MQHLYTQKAFNINQSTLTPSKKARIISLLVFLLWFIVLIYPFFSYRFPPPEQQGILIAFGETLDEVKDENNSESIQENPEENIEEKKSENIKSKSSIEETTESTPTSNTIAKSISKPSTEENSDIPVSEKKQSEDYSKKGKSTEHRIQNSPNKKSKKSEETKSRKQTSQEAKRAFSSFFHKKEETNKHKSGSDKGLPDTNHLKDSVSGKSHIGDGLVKRGILFQPEIVDHSQKTGKVVIKVCVNASGKVISAKHTLSGSTTTDRNLVKIAENAASKYIFSPSGIEEQCGQISIDFKLQ